MTSNTICRTEPIEAIIRVADTDIRARVSVPSNARGLILFAGRASGSPCPASERQAELLQEADYATVLADLTAEHEQVVNLHTGELCSGLDLLAQRLVAVTDWIAMQAGLKHMPLGYFGAGAGAEAAIIAAVKRPEVRAVVTCGARVDRAEHFLEELTAPALFISGNEDTELLGHQITAMAQLPASTLRQLEVIHWTTDPLQDPHAVSRVMSLAGGWYDRYLSFTAGQLARSATQ